jgi:hypothetical protein
LTCGLAFALGFFVGGVWQSNVNDNYQNIASMTCDYSNKITDVLNNQSATLEKCMGKPEYDLERLNKLNCSLLYREK